MSVENKTSISLKEIAEYAADRNLRDQFAVAALKSAGCLLRIAGVGDQDLHAEAAKEAYLMADAMLEARKK